MNTNNFENNFIDRIDRNIKKENEDSLFNESLLIRLRERFEIRYGNTRPDMKDFKDVYDVNEIQNDINYTQKIKNGFGNNDPIAEKKKLAADVFEAIFIEEAMKSAWLGREVRVTPTSEYDDFVNKVDAIAEIKNQEGIQELGIAIDVTFSKEIDDIEKKLNVIKNNIDKGQAPARVKYFKDKEGKRKNIFIPKVIVGCNANTLRELIDLINKKTNSNEIIWKKAENDLNFHYFQTIVLNEILTQVKAFGTYAHKKGQDKTRNGYYKAQKIIEGIIETKALYNKQMKEDEVKNDIVCATIDDYSRNLR